MTRKYNENPTPNNLITPFVTVAFYLSVLPEPLLNKIPRFTRYEWEHKSINSLFGYDWYCQNKHLFDTLQTIALDKKLVHVNKSLLRIIALKQFLKKYSNQIKHKIFNTAGTALANINKTSRVLGLAITLKWLNLSRQQYWQLLQKIPLQSISF